jgi:gamma-glutamylputrescine oxidase
MQKSNVNYSFWEQQIYSKAHTAIIGGGIVGLFTAIFTKLALPKFARVIVLEKGLLPSGASTKNAGFACMGSATELLADLQTASEQEVIDLFDLRWKGLLLANKILGEKNIGYQQNGSYELLTSTQENCLENLDYLNSLLKSILPGKAFEENKKIISTSRFNKNHFSTAIQNLAEGEIHTGKLLHTLSQYAMQCGVEIFTGCHVSAIIPNNNLIDIQIDSNNQSHCWQAENVVVCTNAFAAQLLPHLAITPGRGQVLITKPISQLAIKGIYHFEEGYYYCREIEGRLLFGGGRNVDKQTETTFTLDKNEKIISHLQQIMQEHLLPNTPFEIDTNWSGIMAFADGTKKAIVEHVGNRIFVAARCGGMGVAIGSQLAQQVVKLMNLS